VFYREAGAAGAPVLLLLHGYPSASHQFRELIPLLAGRFHVIAPDLPGFGKTDMPPRVVKVGSPDLGHDSSLTVHAFDHKVALSLLTEVAQPPLMPQ